MIFYAAPQGRVGAPLTRTGAVFADLLLCINGELRLVTGETMGSLCTSKPAKRSQCGDSHQEIVFTLYPVLGRFAEDL